MATRHPIEYEITPRSLQQGVGWLTLRLKNVGQEPLTQLDLRLNSLDNYRLDVFGTGSFLPVLEPKEEKEIPFQVSAEATASVYVTLDGERNGEPWRWESPAIVISVGREVAQLIGLFAMTKPYPILGDKIPFQAVVQGQTPSDRLVLEFWAETPGGELISVAKEPVGFVSAGEEVRHTFEFTPEEEGIYTFHAYLFHGPKRIGHQREYLSLTV